MLPAISDCGSNSFAVFSKCFEFNQIVIFIHSEGGGEGHGIGNSSNSCCEAPHLKMEFLVQKVMRIGRITQTPILN